MDISGFALKPFTCMSTLTLFQWYGAISHVKSTVWSNCREMAFVSTWDEADASFTRKRIIRERLQFVSETFSRLHKMNTAPEAFQPRGQCSKTLTVAEICVQPALSEHVPCSVSLSAKRFSQAREDDTKTKRNEHTSKCVFLLKRFRNGFLRLHVHGCM